MQSANDLKQLLFSINHKSYPAYKSTRGAYQFPRYTLSIDHVQGDPFAAPSRVSVHVSRAKPLHFRLFSTTHMKSASPSRITCCASLRARSRKFPLKRKDLERAALWRSAVRDRKC